MTGHTKRGHDSMNIIIKQEQVCSLQWPGRYKTRVGDKHEVDDVKVVSFFFYYLGEMYSK